MVISQNEMILFVTASLAGFCLLAGFWKHPARGVLFLFRVVFRILLLYGVELCSIKMGWSVYVPVNGLTCVVSGVLGVPGIVLLYAIRFVLL